MRKEIQKPYEISYIKALEATRNCGFQIENESLTEGIIEFKVGISLWSWGETFYLKLNKINAILTSLEVSSHNNQLGSWGKHERNISDFFSALDLLIKK